MNVQDAVHSLYSLEVEPADDLLLIRVSGHVDAQAVRIAYWREIAALGRARGVRKLLVVDRRKGKPATPPELAELAQLFRGEAAHFDRVAVVEPTPEFLPAIEHAEILGQGAGINVRVFGEVASALRWLRYGSPDD